MEDTKRGALLLWERKQRGKDGEKEGEFTDWRMRTGDRRFLFF